MKKKENIIDLLSFSEIKITGFPFFIKINIDKISLGLNFVDNIEIKGVVLETGIFNNQVLKLTNLDKIIVQPDQKSLFYLLCFNHTPFLEITKNKKNIIQKILYKDEGYRIIEENSGEVFDQIEKNKLEYTINSGETSDKVTYSLDFATAIKIKEESKMRDLDEINIEISAKGEKTKDSNTITINNIIFKTPIFIINGYGSIMAKTNENAVFKLDFELNPYRIVFDFIANYFLSKNNSWINKEDIGKYYVAINQTIIPKIKNSSLSEILNLSIKSNIDQKVTINGLSLEDIFEALSSSEYDIIYENSPAKKSFYSSNENLVSSEVVEPINFTKL